MKETIKDISALKEHLAKFKAEDCAMYWMPDDILVQKVSDTIPDFDSIIELRVFNEDKEIYAVRRGDEMYYRFRSDDDAEKKLEYIESEAIVRGVIATKVTEVFTHLKQKNVVIAIKKRDYIGYNEIGAAGYVDSRFVSFTKKN